MHIHRLVRYAFTVHAFPYCMQGNGVCPPHTGPIIELTGILTTLLFLAGSVLYTVFVLVG